MEIKIPKYFSGDEEGAAVLNEIINTLDTTDEQVIIDGQDSIMIGNAPNYIAALAQYYTVETLRKRVVLRLGENIHYMRRRIENAKQFLDTHTHENRSE